MVPSVLGLLGLLALTGAVDNSMNVLLNSNTLFDFALPDGTTGSVEGEYWCRPTPAVACARALYPICIMTSVCAAPSTLTLHL